MSDHLSLWEGLAGGADKADAVREHLGFLCEDDRDRALLDTLMKQFAGAEIAGDQLLLKFQYVEYSDEIAEVECFPPFSDDPAGAPESWAAFAQVHNGMSFESLGGGYFSFNGLDDEGKPVSGNWEPGALTDAEEENEDFLTSLSDAGFGPDDTAGVLDVGQNWIISHPGENNDLDEPMLYFVSHEDCQAVGIDKATKLTMGQVYLRLMVQFICDAEQFEEVYA